MSSILSPTASTIKSKLGNVIVKSKTNVSMKNGGFQLGHSKCKGLLGTLSEKFYSNFVSKNVKLRYGKSKTKVNGMRVGDLFHRQVYHYFKCMNNTKMCVCKSRFKRKTSNIAKGSIHHARVLALKKFLDAAQWVVFDCEVVAGYAEHRIATAIDMICVDNIEKPKHVYVVELKFGYARGLHDISSKRPECEFLDSEACKGVRNTYANHHQLQLWFEIDAMKRTYDITCASGAVVYVRDVPKKKNTPLSATVHAEYAQSWWFKNEHVREKLLEHLIAP